MHPYKLVIFDFDGTLSDSLPWFRGVVNSIAEKHRFKRIEGADAEMLRGKTSREIIKHLEVPMWRLPWISRDMRKLKSENLGDIPLFPRSIEMLERLHDAKILLAIVTSDSESNVRRSLDEAERLFAAFGCGASLFGKSALFTRVMRKLNVKPEDTLCIGDEIRDAEATAKAGAHFGAVAWGYATREALGATSPSLMFETPADIAEKLLRTQKSYCEPTAPRP